jgi:hypothetical protein
MPDPPFAAEAHAALSRMLLGKSFRMETREPGKVILFGEDGTVVNEEMLRGGFAINATKQGTPDYVYYQSMVNSAVQSRSGMFKPPPGYKPPVYTKSESAGGPPETLGTIEKAIAFEGGLVATVSTRVMETNTVWWKYSWKIEIVNTGKQAATVYASVVFQDKDGFPIEESSPESTSIAPGAIGTVSGIELIDVSAAPKVAGLDVKLRRR